MSITVLYAGRRRNVRVEAQSLVQDVVVEAARELCPGLDPDKCQLKYQRTVLPRNQLVRFSSVPNNALVDLVVSMGAGKPSNNGNQFAKIAISVPNVGSVQRNLDSSLCLRDMLAAIVSDGTVPVDSIGCNPELIYMRNSYSGGKLDSTTLASLGLAG
jgi:hypothetical protein